VANTQVKFEVALRVARELRVTELDVSGIGVTDDQLNSQLDFDQKFSLNLSRNPVTDVVIAKLLTNQVIDGETRDYGS